jgi:uncharacterized protein YcbK (DUF882 family)
MHRPARRLIVRLAVAGAPALLVARRAGAGTARPDVLRLVHTHTGETLSVAWRSGGAIDPQAMRRVDRLLRDVRTGDVAPIDPALLEQLQRLAEATGTRAPFQVISGYRSPRTNEMLRRTGGGGVARASLHLEGRAIDVRLADVPLADLRDAARELRAGGVGGYLREGFVHLDTGRVRSW